MTTRAKHAEHSALAVNIRPSVRREEYLDYMTFRSNDRPLFTELFGPLIGLKDEWAEQGGSADELDLSAFAYRAPMRGGVPVNVGWFGETGQEVLEENDEYLIVRDHLGRRMKLMKGYATLPLPLDYPVKTMGDWLRVKPHYEFSEARLAGDWERIAREHLAAGRATHVAIPGGFDEPRQLMGEEGACLAFYDQPELIHDILNTIADTACRVFEVVTRTVQVDELWVHEDLAGKSGPLVGPTQVKEFVGPYYRRVWDLLSSRGARLFGQDSDGNIEGILPDLLDAGLNVTIPVEPAAGMDIVKLRETYGSRLAFMGGIDKHVIRRSQEEIVAELEYKIPPMVRTGGCVLSLDHRIPNGTPLANYRFYIEKAWEIMERESGSRSA
jgi:hypothetical protein